MHTDRRRRVEEEEKNRERADVYLSQEEEDEKWKYLSNSLISFRIRVIFILIKEYFYQVLLGDKKKLKKKKKRHFFFRIYQKDNQIRWENQPTDSICTKKCFFFLLSINDLLLVSDEPNISKEKKNTTRTSNPSFHSASRLVL